MHLSRCYKRLRVRRLKIAVLALVISLFFMPNFVKIEDTGDNMYTVFINGENVGCVGSMESAKACFLKARKAISAESDQLTFLDAEMTLEGQMVTFGQVDSEETVVKNITESLKKAVVTNLTKAYEVKVNDYTVLLSSSDDVVSLLQAAVDKYDEEKAFKAFLEVDSNRELPVLIPALRTDEDMVASESVRETAIMTSGFDFDMELFFEEIEPSGDIKLEDYDTGVVSMEFKDAIEVAEVYVNPLQITDLDTAISDVTEEVLEDDIYTVVANDTLSGIALKVDIPMEDIIAMNDSLEDEHSLIRPGDELVVTVAKPKLTVVRKEVMYYEENYSEDIIIHWDPDKYTTDVTTMVQPSDGHRKIVAEVTFLNGEKSDREIIAQEVTLQAVAKEIKKGEKVPPTYIKPISGGRLTSTFGPRKAPKKGASTYHKGIDWGTPTGTPVYASCGGTVVRAGWGGGYGNCVFINHPDGKQTRYGHLSKVLVSTGQTVSQGQRIALSGNTGVSTGPHLHFEILIGGKQVNPFNYIN